MSFILIDYRIHISDSDPVIFLILVGKEAIPVLS